MRLKTLLAAFGATTLAFSAAALQITPSTPGILTGSNNSNLSAAQIWNIVGGPTLTELYKQNVGSGSDSGTFNQSYTTTFLNTPSDPMNANIVYDGGGDPFISGFGSLWLYIKDGNHQPAFYLVNLATLGWNGTETLELRNFWPQQGAISHVTILGGGTANVPDGGMTLMLLGTGLASLAGIRRFIKR